MGRAPAAFAADIHAQPQSLCRSLRQSNLSARSPGHWRPDVAVLSGLRSAPRGYKGAAARASRGGIAVVCEWLGSGGSGSGEWARQIQLQRAGLLAERAHGAADPEHVILSRPQLSDVLLNAELLSHAQASAACGGGSGDGGGGGERAFRARRLESFWLRYATKPELYD